MSELVDPSRIEQIVGANRRLNEHIGRVVSAEQCVYILHSQACLDHRPDLRECPYSCALDKGINVDAWEDFQDVPVLLALEWGDLEPVRVIGANDD